MKAQQEFIHMYSDGHREKFNPELFERSNDDIIRHLENIILSCQRTRAAGNSFGFEVKGFDVVSQYSEVTKILQQYYEDKNTTQSAKGERKKKNPKYVNPYEHIPLQDTYEILLLVHYMTFIKKEDKVLSEEFTTIIEVPRIIDKYYMYYNGKLYSTMMQLVDASTYNMFKTCPNINFKSNVDKISFYEHQTTIKDINGYDIPITYYANASESTKNSRKKTKNNIIVYNMNYFLAKFGFYGTLKFLGLQNTIGISAHPTNSDICEERGLFCFPMGIDKENPACHKYLVVPKILYSNNKVLQALIFSIHREFTLINQPFNFADRNNWLISLSSFFLKGETNNPPTPDKGMSLLNSLESSYDISTFETLRLPLEDKKDIYKVFRWILYEYDALAQKNNLDVTCKRIRFEELFATMYSIHLLAKVFNLYTKKNRLTLTDIRNAINTAPNALLKSVATSSIFHTPSLVNDNDALLALKYTLRGVSGLGEKKKKGVKTEFMSVHPSHVGILDMDASSAGDPGMSGTLCPMQKVYPGGYFTEDYAEPDDWREELKQLMTEYNKERPVYLAKKQKSDEDSVEYVTNFKQSTRFIQQNIAPFITKYEPISQQIWEVKR